MVESEEEHQKSKSLAAEEWERESTLISNFSVSLSVGFIVVEM